MGEIPETPSTATAHRLALAMASVQIIWLAAIWYAGTAIHWQKIPILLAYSLACGIVAGYRSTAISRCLKNLEATTQGKETFLLRLLVLALLGIFGVYAYLQLGWPDERNIFAASRIVAEKGVSSFFEHYGETPWLGRQHPPLVPLLYGAAMSIFGVHIIVPRLVSLIFALGVLSLTFAIARDLYGKRIALWSAAFLTSTPFLFRVGATGMTDMPMTFFFVLAVFLVLRLVQRPTYLLAGGAGLCIGAGLLCRYPMVLIYPLLVIFATVRGSLLRSLPHLAVVLLVSGTVFAAWIGFAYQIGILEAQAARLAGHAGFATRVASHGHLRWPMVALFFRMPSGLGVANLPLLLIGIIAFVKRRSRSDLLMLLWIAAVSLPLIFTLPGPRFFLPVFPALAIAMACGADRLSDGPARVVILSLLYAAGAMYLFVDWFQAAGRLFSP